MRPRLRILLVAGLLASGARPAQALLWPNQVQHIERDLQAVDVTARRVAAGRIGDLPPALAERAVLRGLSDADVMVRLRAVQAGRALSVPGLSDRVLSWLTESDVRLRLAAAETLASAPTQRAVGPLSRALSDAEPAVRATSAAALGLTGAPEAVIGLLGHIDDSAAEVRESVVRALARLGDVRAVVPLVAKIEDPRPAIRQAVARALGELGDARARSALVLALRDVEPAVRSAALEALGELSDPAALPSISAVLSADNQAAVRLSAIDALAGLGSAEAVAVLVNAFSTLPDERDALVTALARIGAVAAPALVNCVQSGARSQRSDGCALGLSRVRPAGTTTLLLQAARKGAITPEAALDALAYIADPESVPLALEHLGSADPAIRRAALDAAHALLDPARADGRAVEPLVLAFDRARGRRAERLEIVRLLGKTGSPRAAVALVPLAERADDIDFRVAALGALGSLTDASVGGALLRALDDPEPAVRLAAALAIRKSGPTQLQGALFDRLERADAASRPWLALALAGALGRTQAGATEHGGVAARLRRALPRALPGERDALIEVLAHAPGRAAEVLLTALARSRDPADRAKVAEGLARRSDATLLLEELARDADASVRANAVWSLGARGNTPQLVQLTRAFQDEDLAVSANAVAAFGRVVGRARGEATVALCSLLSDRRAVLRAASLSALRTLGRRCEGGRDRLALLADGSGLVRSAAAKLVRDVATDAEDARALRRCLVEEPLGVTAAACAGTSQRAAGSAQEVLVFVVPAGEAVPVARSAFALLRADGLTRYGWSDRRGAVSEAAPSGEVELAVPAALQE